MQCHDPSPPPPPPEIVFMPKGLLMVNEWFSGAVCVCVYIYIYIYIYIYCLH